MTVQHRVHQLIFKLPLPENFLQGVLEHKAGDELAGTLDKAQLNTWD